jgi:glutathione S-transferase
MEPILMPWMLATRKRCGSPETALIPTKRFTKLEASRLVPQFRLTFYDARGMAEMSRLILVYAGVPFEDIRISKEESWDKIKKESPYTLPLLEFNGKKLSGGDAIARMLAKMYGLAGQDVFEQAQADAMLGVMRDFMGAALDYVKFKYNLIFGKTAEDCDLDKLYYVQFVPAVKRYFGILEQYASQPTPDGFFLHSGVSYVDFAAANMFESLNALHPDLLAPYTNIKAIVQRVFALPQLRRYLDRRPKTIW